MVHFGLFGCGLGPGFFRLKDKTVEFQLFLLQKYYVTFLHSFVFLLALFEGTFTSFFKDTES
jgi:hypothetical protein